MSEKGLMQYLHWYGQQKLTAKINQTNTQKKQKIQ